MFRTAHIWIVALCIASPAMAETIEGRWKMISAEDVRASGEVVRKPWGDHPIGSIIVQSGACYVQIMSSDTPAFTGTQPVNEQMSAMLRSSYISYSGPCTYDDKTGAFSLKVEAAWTPNYVGTDQKRMFHFENSKLIFGTLPDTIRLGSERLTRRLTLERVP